MLGVLADSGSPALARFGTVGKPQPWLSLFLWRVNTVNAERRLSQEPASTEGGLGRMLTGRMIFHCEM